MKIKLLPVIVIASALVALVFLSINFEVTISVIFLIGLLAIFIRDYGREIPPVSATLEQPLVVAAKEIRHASPAPTPRPAMSSIAKEKLPMAA